jgi:[histone H3]-N6,N6-dimethyl-L-lysine4 FAD-dependent demethylase
MFNALQLMADMVFQVVEKLASGLNVRLGSVVTTITVSKDSITVELEEGNVLNAQYVICTVPLGVLKENQIHFEPKLPQHKLAAIERLGFGLLDKIVLLFPEKFWEDDSLDGFGQVSLLAVHPFGRGDDVN